MRLRDLTEIRKNLLSEISKNPYATNKRLMEVMGSDETYPAIVKRQLTEQGYLIENNFELDYGKICKNRVDILYASLVFDGSYEYIQELLENIRSYRASFSLIDICFSSYLVSFYSDNNEKIKKILDYLVEKNILYSYVLYKRSKKYYWRYPVFSQKKEKYNSLSTENLLKDTDTPDLEFGEFDRRISYMDIRIIDNLQKGRFKCRKIYEYEKKNGNSFSYFKIKEHFRELIKDKIIEKKPYVFPFPYNECYKFVLCIETDDFEKTKKIIFNIGRNERIFAKITYVSSIDGKRKFGFAEFVTSPIFFVNLMRIIDRVEEIREKRVYTVKNYLQGFPMRKHPLNYYDLRRQEIHYPFDKFFQDLKTMIENYEDKIAFIKH